VTADPFPWPEALVPARDGTMIRVRVNPHASREEIAGVSAGRLVLKVTAPPVDDRANRAAVKLLARRIGLPPSRLEVIRGGHGRNKDILVRGWAPREMC
jgi:uncharacterized protein (TIGR00251 family)